MHELSVATELYLGLRAELDERGGGRLLVAAITVGELAAIEPDLLRFAWEAVTAESCDQGARLEIEWRTVIQRCPACGPIAERVSGSWMRLCPSCKAPLQLEGGHELEITSLTYDVPDDSEKSSPRAIPSLECTP